MRERLREIQGEATNALTACTTEAELEDLLAARLNFVLEGTHFIT